MKTIKTMYNHVLEQMGKTSSPSDLLTLAQTLHVVTSIIPTVNTFKLDAPTAREPGTPTTPTSTKEVLKSQAELHEAINSAVTKPKLPKRIKDTEVSGGVIPKNDKAILTLVRSRIARGRVTENLLLSTVAKAAGFSTTKVAAVIRKYLSADVTLMFGAHFPEGVMYDGYTPVKPKAYYVVPKHLVTKVD